MCDSVALVNVTESVELVTIYVTENVVSPSLMVIFPPDVLQEPSVWSDPVDVWPEQLLVYLSTEVKVPAAERLSVMVST